MYNRLKSLLRILRIRNQLTLRVSFTSCTFYHERHFLPTLLVIRQTIPYTIDY